MMLLALLSMLSMAVELPDLSRPLRSGIRASGDAAVVIGIEEYPFIADVPYAKRDARLFYDTLIYTQGVPPARATLLDERASRERILAAVEEAAGLVTDGGTLWVYFAGHGAASPSTGSRILLGVDVQSDTASFETRSVQLDELRELAVGERTVIVLDTCYSGAGRAGGALLPGKRFAVPVYTTEPSPEIIEWTAAGPDQLSGPLAQARHGAFTYFAVGALRGWADGQLDGSPDGVVTAEEASLYVEEALRLANINDQTPTMGVSSPQSWLLSHGKLEEGPDLYGTASEASVTGPAPVAAQPVVRPISQQPWVGVAYSEYVTGIQEGVAAKADLMEDEQRQQHNLDVLQKEQVRLHVEKKDAVSTASDEDAAVLQKQLEEDGSRRVWYLNDQLSLLQGYVDDREEGLVEGLLTRIHRANDHLGSRRGLVLLNASTGVVPQGTDLTDEAITWFDSYAWETTEAPLVEVAVGWVDLEAVTEELAGELQVHVRELEEAEDRVETLQKQAVEFLDSPEAWAGFEDERARADESVAECALRLEQATERAKNSAIMHLKTRYQGIGMAVLLDEVRATGAVVDLTDDALASVGGVAEPLPDYEGLGVAWVDFDRLRSESRAGVEQDAWLAKRQERRDDSTEAQEEREADQAAADGEFLIAIENAMQQHADDSDVPVLTGTKPIGEVVDVTDLVLDRMGRAR